ncbi:regulatory protein YcgZ [Kalamiella sp. sgz302252]|uniref:regulatory protein YcgZ n=1 Tax=Pantoea sp. sgz302252 TaxID=3341827 RepID=UPI0036D3D43B
MQQSLSTAVFSNTISAYFDRAALPSQQETLGSVVVEILRSGRTLNRKAICMSLLARLDSVSSLQEEQHLQQLIGLLFCE